MRLYLSFEQVQDTFLIAPFGRQGIEVAFPTRIGQEASERCGNFRILGVAINVLCHEIQQELTILILEEF